MPNASTKKTKSAPSQSKPEVAVYRDSGRSKRDFPLIWTIAGAILFIGGIVGYKLTLKPYVDFGATRVVVQLAKTDQQKIKGLSGRDNLPADQGVLFVYDKDQQPKFWMKDMNFPIDIIWLKADGTVVDITSNISPTTCPSAPKDCKSFTPHQPIRYVLEVNANFAREHDIKPGDRANISL